MKPARKRGQSDTRLGQREHRTLRSDDHIAGERDLEAAAHGDTVHGGDHGLCKVEAARDAAETACRHGSAGTGRRYLQIVACAEGAFAGAGDDGDPLLWIAGEIVKDLRKLMVRRRMQRVHDLGAVQGDKRQLSIPLDPAKFVIGHRRLLEYSDQLGLSEG